MVHPEQDLTSFWAQTFAVNLDQLHQELKEHIKTAQSWYQVSADSCQNDTPNRISCVCKSTVLPDHSTFQEACWEISWPFWGYHSSQLPLLHSMTPRQHACSPPCLPCIYAWTHNPKSNSKLNPVTSTSSWNWWWTWIWDIWNPWLQGRQAL